MAKFEQAYEWLARQLATQLDKFKVKNPIVFVVLEGALGTVLSLFVTDVINLPDIAFLVKHVPELATDNVVIGVLAALMAALSPRTTFLKLSQPFHEEEGLKHMNHKDYGKIKSKGGLSKYNQIKNS